MGLSWWILFSDSSNEAELQIVKFCNPLRGTDCCWALSRTASPICVGDTTVLEGHPGDSQPLTFTDEFQGGQEVLVADNRQGQEHVKDNQKVDYDASICALLFCEKPFGKLRWWRNDTLGAISWWGKGGESLKDVGVTHSKLTKGNCLRNLWSVGFLGGILRTLVTMYIALLNMM